MRTSPGKLPNANGPNIPTTNSFLVEGVNYQMQMVKLTNYQLISGGGGELPSANGPI